MTAPWGEGNHSQFHVITQIAKVSVLNGMQRAAPARTGLLNGSNDSAIHSAASRQDTEEEAIKAKKAP
jgi:hypothetical protein